MIVEVEGQCSSEEHFLFHVDCADVFKRWVHVFYFEDPDADDEVEKGSYSPIQWEA